MEQRDYLQRQIEQLGQILGKILANLLNLKSKGQVIGNIEIIDQTLKSELNFDFDALLALSPDEFIDKLKTEKSFSDENLIMLVEILILIADEYSDRDNRKEESKMIYQKCLLIYEYLEKTSTLYSLTRPMEIEQIKTKIQQL